MPSDNEIRGAIKRLNYYETIEKEMASNDEAIMPLREVAELYLRAAKGIPEEAKTSFRSGTNYDAAFANGFNAARSLCIAAFTRKIDEERMI